MEQVHGRGAHAAIASATAAVTAIILAGGADTAVAALPLYVLVALAAAQLLTRRAAVVHAALAVVASAVAVAAAGFEGGLSSWAAVSVAIVATTAVVSALHERVGTLATTDALTGVANRSYWEVAVQHECARAERTKHPLCVAVLSLDGFRDYAYERGQAAAEQLLVESGLGWRSALRAGDVLGRLRADEFAVLLPECGPACADLVLDRLRNATPDGKTFTAGLAVWDEDETATTLVRRAYEALDTRRRQRFLPAA